MSFTRGESIALWTGVILFVTFLGCLFYRLCSVTCRTMISNMGSSRRRKRLNPMEKRVNKILNNESAREILKAHALTAINSQVCWHSLWRHFCSIENFVFQANKRRLGYSSQVSLDSVGTVPDLTDRVVRVSFAPTGNTETIDVLPEAGTETEAGSEVSLGGVSGPPAYDTLSTHSRVSASEPPPEYHAVAVHE